MFNEFYETVQVNREPDPSIKAARLALVEGFVAELKDVLGLCGIETVERIGQPAQSGRSASYQRSK